MTGCHSLTDPAASMQAALESHAWTRQPQFSVFSQSQTGQHAAAATSQAAFPAAAATAASKPAVAATAKKGLLLPGSQALANFPWFTCRISCKLVSPFLQKGPGNL